MFKRLKNIENNLVEVDDNDNKVGIFRIIKDIKDKGIKIDNDDEAIREITERIKELIDDGVKVNGKYRELKKVMIGKGEDYTTGSLLDYDYFIKHYKSIAVDLSKQKELDADPRAIQQIEFKFMLEGANISTIYWVLKKSKLITLAKNKLNMIDTLLSSALNDSKISHEEFSSIITEKNMYENIKENIKETKGPSSLERTEL